MRILEPGRTLDGARPYNWPVRAVWLNRILMLLAFGGVFVAGVLSLAHMMNVIPPCGDNMGCFTVANHASSKWFGIPVAYFGLGGYLFLGALAIGRSFLGVTSDRRLVMAGLLASGIGTAVSIILVIYSLTVIKATCIWCLASAAIMVVTFLVSAALAQMEPDEVSNKPRDFAIGPILAVIAFAAIGAQGWSLKSEAAKTDIQLDKVAEMSFEQLAPASAASLGDKDAAVTIVEFADLTCPACKDSYTHLREIFGKNRGKLRWVFRHYPLYLKEKQHQFALPAALISQICAEDNKFWPFLDACYSMDLEKIDSADPYFEIAKALGYDRAAVERRLSDPNDKAFDLVYEDIRFANDLGISMTPTFFILVKGQKPIPANVNTYQDVLQMPEVEKALGVPVGQ